MKPQIFFTALLMLLIIAMPSFALDKLTGFVNDEAGVISANYRQILNDELYNLKLNASVEMAVATVKSLNGTPIEEYSLNLAHKVLGEQGKDNGVLILLAVDDREYRIEVGYGLEPVLNAALLGRIGRNIMEPSFATGNYGQGLLDGVRTISAILRNDTSAETQGAGSDSSNSLIGGVFFGIMMLPFLIPFLIFLALIIYAIVASVKKGKKGAQGSKDGKSDSNDFLAAMVLASMFGRGRGGGGSGGFGGGGFGGGGFGGGSFGGGGFSGKF